MKIHRCRLFISDIIKEESSQVDCPNMVLNLQSRKDFLEAQLEEKNRELKKLCIAEAELTGVLPIETPFEPSGSPPKFRRRVGTMFEFTEDMIRNFKTSQLQVNSKGRVLNSPKRLRPVCQWLSGGYETLPAKSISSPPAQSPTHGTWGHPSRSSPTKASRTHPYKSRLNIIKKL